MKCLCCGKELGNAKSINETKFFWHDRCVKDFFGTSEMPELDFNQESLQAFAEKSISKGSTVTGVQKKMSFSLASSGKRGEGKRLTLVDYPGGYILKPQSEEYEALPECEHLVMSMARAFGIKTVPFGLIRTSKESKDYAFLTKRIDRQGQGKLAMEDFCQLTERIENDKYKSSYEKCAKVIDSYSSQIGFDKAEFFMRLVFSFIVGNSDMHLKNFSLIEPEFASSNYMLSPAYDLLSVNLVSEDDEETALTLNGKKNRLKRQDFLTFARNIGLNEKQSAKLIDNFTKQESVFITFCEESLLSDSLKEKLAAIIHQRIKALSEE